MDSRGSLTKKDTTISVITASEGVVSPPYSRTATLVGTPGSPLSKQPPPVVHRHYWRVSSAFICFFAIGWGDGATGVVMPDMQIYFHLSYVMGSMLFMTGSVGFALMTFVAEPVAKLLGRFNIASERPSFIPAIFTSKKTAHSLSKGRCISLFLFGLLHCAYFLFSASSPQYYGILIAFFIGGLGKSIQIAQINVFWTSNPRVPGISLLHGTYGIGAFVSPLICQTMKARGFPWRGFFWVSLGLALFNVLFGLYAFKTTQEEFEIEKSLALASEALSQTVARNQTDVEVGGIDSASASKPKLRMSEIARMPFVWTIATVLGVYQGAETIAQGFIVTFLLHERNANPNTVGYVASGFWAGLSIGRVTWGILSPRFSQQAKINYINFALVIAMVFHTLIWQIHSVVVNAVLVSLLGLLVGPTFPLVLDIATNPNTKQKPGTPSPLPIFTPEVQLTGLAIGASCGAMGAAIFSLSTGIAANHYGAFIIEPLALGTVGFVLLFWLTTQIVSKCVRK